MKAVAVLLFGGLAALAFSAKSANAATPPAPGPKPNPLPGPTPTPTPTSYVPQDVLDRVTAVLATGDPKAIRAEAAKLRKEGWGVTASGLDKAATTLEVLLAGGTPAPTPAPAPVPVPGGGGTPAPAPAPAPSPSSPSYVPPPYTPPPIPNMIEVRPVPTAPVVVPVVFPAGGAVPVELVGATLHRMAAPEPYDHRVLVWQERLKVLKFRPATTKSDGKFGPNVETQTKAFQKSKGLTQTGIVEATTLHAAFPGGAAPVVAPAYVPPPPASISPLDINVLTWRSVMKRGNTGQDVKQWRSVLLRDGFTTITPDLDFGPATEASTKAWQTAHGLVPDGKVGNDVKAKLVGLSPLPTVVAGAFSNLAYQVHDEDDAPPVVLELVPAPELLAVVEPDEQTMQDLAADLAAHIEATPEGQEDRARIEYFQRRCGLNATGSYGPATAEGIAFFGTVPPRPRAWPTKKLYRSQTRYRIAMREHAQRDPERAAAWLAAANG
jgi:peptidoglycan hydrolase-like protein with peptidoglycan-binding domain